MFRKIKNWWYQRSLQKKLSELHVVHRSVSLAEVKTICIFFDAADDNNVSAVKKFIHQLEQQNKNVTSVGYLPKEKKDITITLNYFTGKSVSWFNVPHNNLVEEYADKSFDLLLNLYVDEAQPLEYLSALSNATCRVGRYIDNKSYYCDLMIALKQNDTLQHLIEQTENYLNQINASQKNVATV